MSSILRHTVWASAALAASVALQGCALDQPLRHISHALTPAASGVPAAQPNTPQHQARQRMAQRFPDAFLRGDYVDSTQFSGVWAIRNKEPTLPRYFSEALDWVINTPEPMGYMVTSPEHSKAIFDAQRKALAQEIDTTPWPLVPGKTKPKVVVFSAWDCPYSRQMEADLRKAGISYYLIPSGLNEQSKALAARIYGTPQFHQQWNELLAKGRISSAIGTQSQPYPEHAATDIAFVFKVVNGVPSPVPQTPLFVMKDGRSGEGWSKKQMLPLIQKSQGHF